MIPTSPNRLAPVTEGCRVRRWVVAAVDAEISFRFLLAVHIRGRRLMYGLHIGRVRDRA